MTLGAKFKTGEGLPAAGHSGIGARSGALCLFLTLYEGRYVRMLGRPEGRILSVLMYQQESESFSENSKLIQNFRSLLDTIIFTLPGSEDHLPQSTKERYL